MTNGFQNTHGQLYDELGLNPAPLAPPTQVETVDSSRSSFSSDDLLAAEQQDLEHQRAVPRRSTAFGVVGVRGAPAFFKDRAEPFEVDQVAQFLPVIAQFVQSVVHFLAVETAGIHDDFVKLTIS